MWSCCRGRTSHPCPFHHRSKAAGGVLKSTKAKDERPDHRTLTGRKSSNTCPYCCKDRFWTRWTASSCCGAAHDSPGPWQVCATLYLLDPRPFPAHNEGMTRSGLFSLSFHTGQRKAAAWHRCASKPCIRRGIQHCPLCSQSILNLPSGFPDRSRQRRRLLQADKRRLPPTPAPPLRRPQSPRAMQTSARCCLGAKNKCDARLPHCLMKY
jgi:hypothetical protein